jgi:serine/threonine protein kinase
MANRSSEPRVRFQADNPYKDESDGDEGVDTSNREVASLPPRREGAGGTFHSTQLRGNLMREQVNRDPLFYYDVVSVLGVGSMGSVAKVQKKQEVVGGSARKELQDHFRRERRLDDCFKLPLVGGLFQFCLTGVLKMDSHNAFHRSHDISSNSSSILQPRATGDANRSSNESINSTSSIVYAMKSIHLSRVTDDNFVQELRNEIQILRTLDHPHIVRAMETFEYRNQIFIVMELCSGGDLYSRDPYTEEESARITSAILSAIAYMHGKVCVH